MPSLWPGVSSDAVFAQFAARLGTTPPSQLDPRFATIVTDCLNLAQADIRLIMGGKGYLPSDLASWDDAGVYVERLALFYALSDTRVLREYPGIDDKAIDPRAMLGGLAFIIAGGIPVAPKPQASDVGGISGGDSIAGEKAIERYEQRVHGFGPRRNF